MNTPSPSAAACIWTTPTSGPSPSPSSKNQIQQVELCLQNTVVAAIAVSDFFWEAGRGVVGLWGSWGRGGRGVVGWWGVVGSWGRGSWVVGRAVVGSWHRGVVGSWGCGVVGLWGLHINGDKTECVCCHQCAGETILVGGQTVQIQGPNHGIKVLGATFTMGSSVSVGIAAMQQKARATLACNKSIFRGKGTMSHKATMSDALIRPSALWGCRTWPCHTALLQAANTVQLRIL